LKRAWLDAPCALLFACCCFCWQYVLTGDLLFLQLCSTFVVPCGAARAAHCGSTLLPDGRQWVVCTGRPACQVPTIWHAARLVGGQTFFIHGMSYLNVECWGGLCAAAAALGPGQCCNTRGAVRLLPSCLLLRCHCRRAACDSLASWPGHHQWAAGNKRTEGSCRGRLRRQGASCLLVTDLAGHNR
jgi:hypothetical protein